MATAVSMPQADNIWDVARVVDVILGGATAAAAVGAALGAKVPRQGHYYVQAACTLGLVEAPEAGKPLQVSRMGQTFAAADRTQRHLILRVLVQQQEPLHTVVECLRVRGVMTREGLTRLVQQTVGLAPSTAHRRAQTISCWLTTLGLARWEEGGLRWNAQVATRSGSSARSFA